MALPLSDVLTIIAMFLGLLGGIIGLSARVSLWALKSWAELSKNELEKEISTLQECTRHLEKEAKQDADNLETWKLKYVEGHAEVTGRVRVLEGELHSSLRQLETDMRVIREQLPLIAHRLNSIEQRQKGLPVP